MKSRKRKSMTRLAVAAAVVLACTGLSGIALSDMAYADGEQWVPVANESQHSYNMYQIFTGTPADDNGVSKLVVEGWGSGILDAGTFVSQLKADPTIGSYFADVSYDGENPAASAVAVAKVIEELGIPEDGNSAAAHAFFAVLDANRSGNFASIGKNTSNVEVDGYGYYVLIDAGGSATAQNIVMLRVVDSDGITIAPKTSTPTIQKFIALEDVSNDRIIDWQKAATTDETLQIKLVAGMPSNVGNFDRLDYTMIDVLGGIVTPDNSTVRVVVKNGEAEQVITQDYLNYTYYGGAGHGGTYSAQDPIAMVFVVDIDAMLASGRYDITDDSTVEIVYTGIINSTGPNAFSSDARMKVVSSSYGDSNVNSLTTGYDRVRVVRPQLTANKLDMNNAALAGAEFELLTVDDEGVERSVRKFTVADDGEISSFVFHRLGDGKYVLRETKTPDDAAYDYAADVQFVLTSEYDESTVDFIGYSVTDWDGAARSDIALDANYQSDTVVMSTSIVNWDKGKTPIVLPETGGSGTVAFYIIGGILVLGAGAVLVVRKRSQRGNARK